jgi:hypothetical protein
MQKSLICTIDTTNEQCIKFLFVIRRILEELMECSNYQNHLCNLITLTNAVASNNIDFIEEQIQAFEKVYLTQTIVFKKHPIEYLRYISMQNMNLFRHILKTIADCNMGDNHIFSDIETWFLSCDIDLYQKCVKEILEI